MRCGRCATLPTSQSRKCMVGGCVCVGVCVCARVCVCVWGLLSEHRIKADGSWRTKDAVELAQQFLQESARATDNVFPKV